MRTCTWVCSGPHRTSECPRDRVQKCPLCNGAHTSWDKRCEHRKKEYLRIEAAKQNTPRLHEVRSKTNPPRRESSGDMRPPPRPKQRSQSVNASPQTQTSQPSASVAGKRGRSSSNSRPPLQTTSGNASRFTAPAKVRIFERPQPEANVRITQTMKICNLWIPSASYNTIQENLEALSWSHYSKTITS